MANTKQTIKGNNNVQIGTNNGNVTNITTKRVVQKNTQPPPNYTIHISNAQAKEIIDKIKENAMFLSKADGKNYYGREQNAFKNAFKLTSYYYLQKEQFDEAIIWLEKSLSYHLKS